MPPLATPTVTDTTRDLNWMCPKCSLLDRYSNSYRQVIIPLGLQSATVFRAMLAVAAGQLQSQDRNSAYRETALRYRGSAISDLSNCIAVAHRSPHSSTRTEILGAILLLCLFELTTANFVIKRPTQQDWQMHGLGARGILESALPSQYPQFDEAITSFLGNLLSARAVLAITTLPTTCDDTSLLSDARYWLSKNSRVPHEINCFTGCSNELLNIIFETVALHWHIRKEKNPVAPDGSKLMLEERLESLGQVLPANDDRESNTAVMTAPAGVVSSAANPKPLRIAEAYRQAAIILVQYLDPCRSLEENPTIQDAVSSILSDESLLAALPLPSFGKAGRSSFLWPYFVAACHATADEQRLRIMETFNGGRSRHRCSTDVLEPMMETIQSVWNQRDLEQIGVVPPRHNGTARCFPWEKVLRHKGWSLNWS